MSCHRRFRWYSLSVMALQLASVPVSSWLNTLLPDVHSSTATQWLHSFIGFQTWLSRRVTYGLVLLFQNPWGQDATVCVSESLSSEVFCSQEVWRMGGIGVSCGYIIVKKASSNTEIIPFHSSCNREMLFWFMYPESSQTSMWSLSLWRHSFFRQKKKIISGLYLWSHIKRSSHLLLREKKRMRNEEYYKETSFLTLW